MKKIIEYFSGKHIFTNFLLIAVIIGAVLFWEKTGKEELPNINFDRVRISTSYPGATAEEVDLLITSEIESALDGIDGIKTITSSSGQGSCSVMIELDPSSQNRATVVTEIGDALNYIDYPDDVDVPRVIEFKSSRFSIIDFALYYQDTDILSDEERVVLQDYCDTLADKLKRLPSVSDVDSGGYLNRFLEISVNPSKLSIYDISLNEISSAIKAGNINQPVGVLDDDEATKIKLDAALIDISHLENLIIRANFEGYKIRLKDLARVSYKFETRDSITKVNGNEAVTLRVTKTSSTGILAAVDSIKQIAAEFTENTLAQTNIELHFMDDESVSVRNRLSIITSNGLLGFILIVVILFIFLDAKSSIWVAMGIPFTLASTMIIASLLGNTINNMTLAAVIIVMGMVVDDAIVVAENVTRLRSSGLPPAQAVTKGTAAVFAPIVASITTTCAAFIPLFFFKGRFGMFTAFLPVIIFIMLGSSLFEAIFILPSHLRYQKRSKKSGNRQTASPKVHWFMRVETAYGNLLTRILKFKTVIVLILAALLLFAGLTFFTQMKFSMFPREETTHLHLTGAAPIGTLKFETEKLMRQVEDIFIPYLEKEVVGFNSSIARSRRGGAVKENEFNISIDLVSREQRKKSNADLVKEWEQKLGELSGFISLSFAAPRFGQSSGSPIDIIIQESNDSVRYNVAQEVLAYLQRMPSLKNQEIEAELVYPQNVISIDRSLAERLGVSVGTLASTLRTILSGNNVYDIIMDDKEIQVMLTIDSGLKKNMNSVLQIPLSNNQNYLIPLFKLVSVTKNSTPNTISKLDGKRVLHVFADLTGTDKEDNQLVRPTARAAGTVSEETGSPPDRSSLSAEEPSIRDDTSQTAPDILELPFNMTPLEIAEHLEKNLIPELARKYPTTQVSFGGEIADTREAGGDFEVAIIIVILLIYVILALTLNSLVKPFIILFAIPFGCVGIIFALQLHGILIYGFFSAVGALGLAGVVVNDSIVLLDKLEKEYNNPDHGSTPGQRVANITKTRLRAVLLTTITTVAGLLPTAYGVFGYDSMLSEMMLTMAWGLIFGTIITLVLVPAIYCGVKEFGLRFKEQKGK
ncbi:MAG: efflux RND transporter permease subunit [Spirochaetales bacterium]|nr:efflux RND transporter permease subunit [Spirochaetales bacterium]